MEEAFSKQSLMVLDFLRRRYAPVEGIERHGFIDFMHEFGSVSAALLHARLFVPEFKVIADRVIWDSSAEAYAKAVEKSASGVVDPDSFNWVEVYYMFVPPRQNDDGDEGDELLAELIAEAWRGRLLLLFPDRKFVVEVMPPEVTGSVVGVGFREIMA